MRFMQWRRMQDEMAEEMEAHIAERAADLMRQGQSADAAQRQARVEFGGAARYQEECRDSLGTRLLNEFVADVRFGIRTARQNPVLTTVLLLCLCVGIGGSTAIFSVVNAVMLKGLPVKEPQQLSSLGWTNTRPIPEEVRSSGTGYGAITLPYQTYLSIKANAPALREAGITGVFAYTPMGFQNPNVKVVVHGQPSMASGELVTGEYFAVLGTQPTIGRAIKESDVMPGAPLVAVISYRYWRNSFGMNPAVLGSVIHLNGVPTTIVGVCPPYFQGVSPTTPADIWAPMRGDPALFPWGASPQPGQTLASRPDWWWLPIFVRHRSGMTEEQVQRVLTPVFRTSLTAGLSKKFNPDDLPSIVANSAAGGLGFLQSNLSMQLRVLMVAIGLLLLIGCSNVATLLLSRASARQREMSIRMATGATRLRIARQVLTEILMLSCVGGVTGVILAIWAGQALLHLLAGPEIANSMDVRLDARVFLFSLVVSFFTAILFGVAPAIRSAHADPFPNLKESSSSVKGNNRLSGVFVSVQVAFSLLLLILSGLFLETMRNLQNQPTGFNAENVLLFELDPRSDGFQGERLMNFYNNVTRQIKALPGVRWATTSTFALLSGWGSDSSVTTDTSPMDKNDLHQVHYNPVGADYLQTMGIKVVLGRDLQVNDIEKRRRVAVIDEQFAKRYFKRSNPLGHRFSFGQPFNAAESFEVIGVAQTAKFEDLRSNIPAMAYVAYSAGDLNNLGRMTFAVSAHDDPLTIVNSVKKAVASLDSQLPLIQLQTQEQLVAQSLRQERVMARLSAIFAVTALLLAAVGLYGNLSYAVARRTNEIGIRMALGAKVGQTFWMVLRNSVVLIGCGAVIGWLLAYGCTRMIQSFLYEVKPMDATVLIAATAVLAVVSLAAAAVAAWRAVQVDPLVALRYE